MFISRAHLVEVFFTKLVFNLKSEASKTYLSYIWWLLEPALMVAVLYLVFGVFLETKTSDFLIFLICGRIPFSWFSRSIGNATGSIIAGRGLINQVSIPMPFFPLLVVFQDAFKQTVVFVFMFGFLYLYGLDISWVWLSIIFVILTQFLLTFAFAMLVAAVTPYIPDFRYLISTGLMALMLGSGIFYSYTDVIHPDHQRLFLMNPIANLIKNYRQVLMDNVLPDWSALGLICLGSLVLIMIMTWYYKKTETNYARLIAQ
ncbi:MAG: ABC transporter permease [Xanthomonadales bacterium]|nr:ABC transporter permease [Xanthomonadales bacterium]